MKREYRINLNLYNPTTILTSIFFNQDESADNIIKIKLYENHKEVELTSNGIFVVSLARGRTLIRDKIISDISENALVVELEPSDLQSVGQIKVTLTKFDDDIELTIGSFYFFVKSRKSAKMHCETKLFAHILEKLEGIEEEVDELKTQGVPTGEVDPIFTAEKDTLATKEEMQEGANKTEGVIQEVIDNFKWRE